MPSRDNPGKTPRSSAQTRSLASGQRERPPIGGAIPGFFGTLWRVSGESQKTRDQVAERAGFEPRDTETPTRQKQRHSTGLLLQRKHVWWRRTDRLTSVPSTPNARLQFRACGGARARLWASDQEVNGGNPRSPIYRAPWRRAQRRCELPVAAVTSRPGRRQSR